MLVYLHQYRENDANESVGGDEPSIDVSPGEYFNVDELAVDEWNQVERGGHQILRRAVSYENVARVSVPERGVSEEGDSSPLPGERIQLRVDGETEYVENATLVEITDETP